VHFGAGIDRRAVAARRGGRARIALGEEVFIRFRPQHGLSLKCCDPKNEKAGSAANVCFVIRLVDRVMTESHQGVATVVRERKPHAP
jgi:hypothetical protein